jgi:hypothetical protein
MVSPRAMRGRVRRGARLLDERYGRLWRLLVDPERLDMAVGAIEEPSANPQACGCVLSQLDLQLGRHNLNGEGVGMYGAQAERLDLTEHRAIIHGFLADGDSRAEMADEFEVLDELWRIEIAEPV